MRFLKVAGAMGPETTKAFVEVAERVKSVKLGEHDATPVTEESLRTACGANGTLVLYSDAPTAQCMSRLASFCHAAGLATWAGDTAKVKPEAFGVGSKMEFLPTDPTNIVAESLLHQPRRKPATTIPDSNFLLKPETLAAMSPAQRHAFAVNIEKANELDDANLTDFKNRMANKARVLKMASRQKVLDFMDKLAEEDRHILPTSP